MAPMASGRNGSNDLEAVHPPHAHDFDARRQRAFQLLLLAQPRISVLVCGASDRRWSNRRG